MIWLNKSIWRVFYDFENREAIFIAVHRSYKFCLLGISKRRTEESRFGFFLSRTKQLEEKNRVFNLKAEEIALINPNTLTCPVFRTSEDAQLTKKNLPPTTGNRK